MKRSSTRRTTRLSRHLRLTLHEKKLSKAGYKLIAGVDEAGRGPLAGPVVAGAVILNSFEFEEDINDSKKLSSAKREKAFKEIFKKAAVGIGIVDEKTIDKINIYKATRLAMEKAIANLKIPPDYVIVDGKVKIRTKCPLKCIVRGDSSSLSIAAASIIAKVTRDNMMREYDKAYPEYGFARHKGYGTKGHMAALETCGPSPIHRYSFHPVRANTK